MGKKANAQKLEPCESFDRFQNIFRDVLIHLIIIFFLVMLFCEGPSKPPVQQKQTKSDSVKTSPDTSKPPGSNEDPTTIDMNTTQKPQ